MRLELIDIHTHVIPGIDDGAQTDDDSLQMLGQYERAGFRTIIATPHAPTVVSKEFSEQLQHGRDRLISLFDPTGIDLVVMRGTEVRLTPALDANPEQLIRLSLAGSRYVLVDFPSGSWPHYAEEALFRVQTLGLIPILAHPERYGWGLSNRTIGRDIVDRGVKLQVTLGSFVGAFGSRSRSVAIELLESGLVHFTATDAHGSGGRMRSALKGIEWLQLNYGSQVVEDTLVRNPNALLNSTEISPHKWNRRRKHWIGFDFTRLVQRIG